MESLFDYSAETRNMALLIPDLAIRHLSQLVHFDIELVTSPNPPETLIHSAANGPLCYKHYRFPCNIILHSFMWDLPSLPSTKYSTAWKRAHIQTLLWPWNLWF